MSQAISDLMNDHEAILMALKILDRIAENIQAGQPASAVDLQSFIGFLKEFADKCHHGKEEDILFPALAGAGIAKNGGPIGVMLSEHVQGRSHIKAMESALANGPDFRGFAAAAREYSQLLVAHIAKENTVLFPMAEQALDSAKLEQIHAAFLSHEETVIGHGRHEELHQMLHQLSEKYLD